MEHPTPGWVYLIGYAGEDGDSPVKIGYGRDPFARRSSLQTGSHKQLVLIDKVPGDRLTERAFHEAMAEHRIEREWFGRGHAVRHAFDAIREAMLDLAAEKMGPDWTPDQMGLDGHYEREPAHADIVKAEIANAFVYFDYGKATGDWNLEADDVPPALQSRVAALDGKW